MLPCSVAEKPKSLAQKQHECPVACRTKHQWMAFIDVDEFLVITDTTVASLPQLLREYTDYGALAVNWQVTKQNICMQW